MCITATNNFIGSSLFVIDCFELVPGEKPKLAVEVANLHHDTDRMCSLYDTDRMCSL